MGLTGKCKEYFDKWLKTKHWDDYCLGKPPIKTNGGDYNKFDWLPESMKWGVYVDFFDSVGIEINDAIGFYDILTKDDVFLQEECDVKTRKSARAEALEKANEIYNNYDTNGES